MNKEELQAKLRQLNLKLDEKKKEKRNQEKVIQDLEAALRKQNQNTGIMHKDIAALSNGLLSRLNGLPARFHEHYGSIIEQWRQESLGHIGGFTDQAAQDGKAKLRKANEEMNKIDSAILALKKNIEKTKWELQKAMEDLL